MFELALAGDVARAEGLDPSIPARLEGTKRGLKVCLSLSPTRPRGDNGDNILNEVGG